MAFSGRPGGIAAYQRINVETRTVDQHQLANMLFDGVLQEITKARGAIERGDLQGKISAISRAVIILEEGLMTGLDLTDGGDLAQNLFSLYDYCLRQLVLANLHGDVKRLEEVQALLEPVAQGWKEIRSQIDLGVGAVAAGEAVPPPA
jgi:flagellar protein FliS